MLPRRAATAATAIIIACGVIFAPYLSAPHVLAVPPQNSTTAPSSAGDASPAATSSAAAVEARGRAELLHETIHAALQVVHHEYYREDEGLAIPALTLKKVFRELATRKNVELRWLVVDATPMNTDHLAKNDFERAAVAALAAGKDSFESRDRGVYRYAAPITLGSECLKCHLPNRKSTESRRAALVIGFPPPASP